MTTRIQIVGTRDSDEGRQGVLVTPARFVRENRVSTRLTSVLLDGEKIVVHFPSQYVQELERV